MATAASVGVEWVAATCGTADVLGQKAVRSAGGAHFMLEVVRRVDVAAAVELVRSAGGRTGALDDGGDAPWQADLAQPFALVVAEGPVSLGVSCDLTVGVRGRTG